MYYWLEAPQNVKQSSYIKKGRRYPAICTSNGNTRYGRYFAVNFGLKFPGYTSEYDAPQLDGGSWIVTEEGE